MRAEASATEAARERAEYYQKVMLPLRARIVEETQLLYNAMQPASEQLGDMLDAQPGVARARDLLGGHAKHSRHHAVTSPTGTRAGRSTNRARLPSIHGPQNGNRPEPPQVPPYERWLGGYERSLDADGARVTDASHASL